MAILSGVRQILHLNWTPEGPASAARSPVWRRDVDGSTGPRLKSVSESGTRIAAHETGANHQNIAMLSLRDSAQRHVAGAARIPILGALTFPPQSLTLYADQAASS